MLIYKSTISIEFYKISGEWRYLQKVQMLRRKKRKKKEIARFVNWIQTQNEKRILIIFKSFQRYAIAFNLVETRFQATGISMDEFHFFFSFLSFRRHSRNSQSPYHLAMMH